MCYEDRLGWCMEMTWGNEVSFSDCCWWWWREDEFLMLSREYNKMWFQLQFLFLNRMSSHFISSHTSRRANVYILVYGRLLQVPRKFLNQIWAKFQISYILSNHSVTRRMHVNMCFYFVLHLSPMQTRQLILLSHVVLLWRDWVLVNILQPFLLISWLPFTTNSFLGCAWSSFCH